MKFGRLADVENACIIEHRWKTKTVSTTNSELRLFHWSISTIPPGERLTAAPRLVSKIHRPPVIHLHHLESRPPIPTVMDSINNNMAFGPSSSDPKTAFMNQVKQEAAVNNARQLIAVCAPPLTFRFLATPLPIHSSNLAFSNLPA